jgi:P-type Cu+ transporter
MGHPAKTLTSLNAVDAVCGMNISARSPHRYVFDGIEYVFCSERCEKQFAADPSVYVRAHAMDQAADQGDVHVH